MFDATACRSTLRRLMLAGALVLPAAGISTAAQALPVSPIAQPADHIQTVQYVDGHRHHHHYRHMDRHHPRRYGYHGRSGLYSCAPGHVNTHLARKACGGAKFPNRFH